jgi:hypothetical protein
MYDLIPTNKNFTNNSVYSDHANILGDITIIASSGQSYVENMLNGNYNSYWESDPLFDKKIDDGNSSSTISNLNYEPCSGPEYLQGTCNNLYTGFNEVNAYTEYLSNGNDNQIIKNKINTTFKGEELLIVLPVPHYLFETHISFIKDFQPKRYFVFAYDNDIKKWKLLNAQLDIDYNKSDDNLPINTHKKYTHYKFLFSNALENNSIRINKLQLKGDIDLSNAPNSKYKYNDENFENLKKKVSFSDIKYIYEYEDNLNNINYMEYLIPFSLVFILFIIASKKKII